MTSRPSLGEQERERAGPAADVQYTTGAELVGDRSVDLEVAAVGIERVVQRGQPRVLEDGVGHARADDQSGFGVVQSPASFSRTNAFAPAIGMRSCASESRSRMVTVSSSSVCSSIVSAYGVPISSWRR